MSKIAADPKWALPEGFEVRRGSGVIAFVNPKGGPQGWKATGVMENRVPWDRPLPDWLNEKIQGLK